MADPDSPVPDSVRNALRGSGFPFQTAVRHLINPSIGWQLSVSEYPWRTPDGDDRFLDIVATKGELHACIECKKTRKEQLIFLLPVGYSNTGDCADVRCLLEHRTSENPQGELWYEDWLFKPTSKVSEFCVVSTSESGRDQRMLERDAREVTQATVAYAHQIAGERRTVSDPLRTSRSFFLPLVVTNAPIYTARYQPTMVSLASGEFSDELHEISKVPWIRFQKAFTASAGSDMGEVTVFVVHSEALKDFLKVLSPSTIESPDRAPVRIR